MWLFVSSALAGSLGISTVVPAVILVDGQPIGGAVGEPPAWMEVTGGASHIIEARTTSNRPITSLDLVVPDGFEVLVEYRDRHFAVASLAAVAPQRAPETIVVVPRVTVRAGPGGQVGSVTGTSVYVGGAILNPQPGPSALPPVGPALTGPAATGPAPKAPAATGPVLVEFRSLDGEWADIYVDGEKRAEFRVDTNTVGVSLTPGRHKVEIRDFMGKKTWDQGYLEVPPGSPLKIGFGENAGVEVYNFPDAWIE